MVNGTQHWIGICFGNFRGWPVPEYLTEETPLRLTPVQIGMYALLGEQLPMGMPREWSLSERIRYGHDFLVDLAKIDLGYDPAKWHEHLRATNTGGYCWSNKHLGFPKRIAAAVVDEQWRAAVEQLSRVVKAPIAAKD